MIIKPFIGIASKLAFLFLLCLISTSQVNAQVYPIQAMTQITPPYSVYLSDYTTPGANKLGLNLMLTDITKFNYAVKLKLIIEGDGITINTSPYYMPQHIILDGGSPQRFDGYDLASYFDPRNLDFKGYSKEKFMQTGALPEGIYRIGFQVLDYNNNKPVSSTGSAMAWLVLNDPPLINMPDKNAKLIATEPQNIMFQWMPRHLGSPNSAFNAEYVFQLFEIWPAGRNPNEVVASVQPLIEKILTPTTFIYSNMQELALEPGRQYAFRVQARDVEGHDLFRNKGYSEVQMFTYGDPCDIPTQINAKATAYDRINIAWQPTTYNTAFYVQYRQKDRSGSEWFPKNIFTGNVNVDKLKPATTYEYQVKGICGSVNSEFSPIQTITTQEKKNPPFACGGGMDSILRKASPLPLTSLLPGDKFMSGKFEVQVTQAVAIGSKGTYTGEGFMRVPFMGVKVHVKFTSIFINENNQVLRGNVESVYNINSNFANQPKVPDVTTPKPIVNPLTKKDTIAVADIDTIVKSPTGDVLVVSENGDTTTIHRNADGSGVVISSRGDSTAVAAGQPVVVADANGKTTTVDSNGNIGNTNENISLKYDSIHILNEIVFILQNAEYKKQPDSNYPNVYVNEDEVDANGNLQIKLKNNDLVSNADNIVWEGATGNKEIANFNTKNIPDNGQNIKVKIDNLAASLIIKKSNKFIKIKTCDKYFAPTVENLETSYIIKSSDDFQVKKVKLEVFSANDLTKPLFSELSLDYAENVEKFYRWNGLISQGDKKGSYIDHTMSPYVLRLTASSDDNFSNIQLVEKEFKVEINSISITPDGKYNIVKSSKIAAEIETKISASVKFKSKNSTEIATSLPVKIAWEFEDPDDSSSAIIIDFSDNGDDNEEIKFNGKRGIESVFWKNQNGFNNLIDPNGLKATSDVKVDGANNGKTEIIFLSSVIAGDNYNIMAKIFDTNKNVIFEKKTKTWTVRKTVSFLNLYKMNEGKSISFMEENSINPAFSGDGCTDYTASRVINLPDAQSPEYLSPLLPPNAAETPTAQEKLDYTSIDPAIQKAAQIAIENKAQSWVERNKLAIGIGLRNLVRQIGASHPCIIGGKYAHPKMDGRFSTGKSNYYPKGILVTVNSKMPKKSPDDEWYEPQAGTDPITEDMVFYVNINNPKREPIVGRHETGHASDHVQFGVKDDHAVKGLMNYSADQSEDNPDGVGDFSDESIVRLRGSKR